MKALACPRARQMSLLRVRSPGCGSVFLSLVTGQDLDTMEESAEIKVEAHVSKTSWIQSHVAASGKRVSRALSYITGEMKECGEGLKGKGLESEALDPTPKVSLPVIPRGHKATVLDRLD